MVDLGGSRLFYNINVLIPHSIKAPETAKGITTGKGFFTVMLQSCREDKSESCLG